VRRRPKGEGRLAVITMVRDEAVMLPRWVQYYGDQVGHDNLFVFDDGSTDGGTDDLPCSVLRLPPLTKEPFEPARMGTLSGLAAALLHSYDAVLFADADEFVVPDPDKYDGLSDYVSRQGKAAAVGVVGLNVVHLAGEPALAPGRPMLEQRPFAKFLPLMCKPSLVFSAPEWRWASHGIMTPYDIDRDLLMFHMKFVDRQLLQETSDRRKAMVEHDGRADITTWARGGDVLVSLLDRISVGVDPSTISEFVPRKGKLNQIVQPRPDGTWRATGLGQAEAMERLPLVRIPERFRRV
jgi:hypothetical protein